VNIEDHKELLGMWISDNEGTKFWLNVLTELQNRGVNNILIACLDALKGFSEAINTVSLKPKFSSVLCIWCVIR
jgi:transposase-like protein